MSRRRSCCCCCACPDQAELWSGYAPGPVPDPPWQVVAGSALVAAGAQAVNPAAGTISATAFTDHEATFSISALMGTDGVETAALFLLDLSTGVLVGGGFGVAPGSWGVSIQGVVTPVAHVGLTGLVTINWNDAGDVSVTIGAEVPVVGSFAPAVLNSNAGIGVQLAGAVEGTTSVGPIATDCTPLP